VKDTMAHLTTSSSSNVYAAQDHARVFSFFNHASLWFSLGVGLLVIQVGTYLSPAMGTQDALFAIVAGSIIGSALLAWVARIGCQGGYSSAGLMQAVFGSHCARLPIVLNVFQLIGWTTFELVVMRDGTQAVIAQATGWQAPALFATAMWGCALLGLGMASMLTLVRRVVARVALPLVVVSLLWLTWHFAALVMAQGFSNFWDRPSTGAMSTLSAVDLVMAMPISWLPLVVDFARHGRDARTTFSGTWIGYALANMWCYALGVMVVSTVPDGTHVVGALLLAQGGLIALGLILLDELDNAYGDMYSASTSSHALLPQLSVRQWAGGLTVLATALAMVVPIYTIEPFLLLLSSVFVPLFGVIIGRAAWSGVVQAPGERTYSAVAIWLLGVVVFHAIKAVYPSLGSALPTLLLTISFAFVTRPQVQLHTA
jgi:nucleobase:cation symporter-1, NCS1 family